MKDGRICKGGWLGFGHEEYEVKFFNDFSSIGFSMCVCVVNILQCLVALERRMPEHVDCCIFEG